MQDTQVLIVGAGPVGLVLALDLAQRGVRATLIEKNETSIQLPKMERCNARTMEIFRRLDIADRVRKAGLRNDGPMDVFLALSMDAEEPLCHLPCPSVDAAKAEIAAHNDGRPLEPYQLISQYTLEPLLHQILLEYPSITIEFGCELTSFEQDANGVTGNLRFRDGRTDTIRARYLAGCDGGASTVRKQLGYKLEGQGAIRKLRQALYYAPDLYEKIPMGKGRHYHIATGPYFPFIIIQDSTKHWTMHAAAESDEEMVTLFRQALGSLDVEFEMLSCNEWTQHLLCAEKYRDGNVFIAGDAAHLVIPTGGLGMNTGVGDAIDLSWKLAATLAGWAGPEVLDSYEIERRQIGIRNVGASGAAMSGRLTWRAAWTPAVTDDTAEGAAVRAKMASEFDAEQRKVTEILGIEAGYRYQNSPIITTEPGEGPDPNNRAYVPTTWPGFRLPHVWLEDGTSILDRLGKDFTLLRLGGTSADTTAFEAALHATGAPLDVQSIPDAVARALYGYDLILVRPDLHIVWRGNAAPTNAADVAALVTGHKLLTPA
jgi:2-polyprenyl-6-methoxyphenol hydroxylase-like FAD-dependent oxidoreductase